MITINTLSRVLMLSQMVLIASACQQAAAPAVPNSGSKVASTETNKAADSSGSDQNKNQVLTNSAFAEQTPSNSINTGTNTVVQVAGAALNIAKAAAGSDTQMASDAIAGASGLGAASSSQGGVISSPLSSLTSAQLGGLTPTQLASLTPAQTAALLSRGPYMVSSVPSYAGSAAASVPAAGGPSATPRPKLGTSNIFNSDGCDMFTDCDPDMVDPLIIDMTGKGIVLSSPIAGVEFDLKGTGEKDQVSWPLGENAGFLVLNRHAKVENINQLFGNNTVGPDRKKAANGFEALRKYDVNHDGRVDAKDPIFTQLGVWIDRNHDGICDDGEVMGLDQAGIKYVEVDYQQIHEMDQYGNETLQRSVAGSKQGGFKLMFDVWFFNKT